MVSEVTIAHQAFLCPSRLVALFPSWPARIDRRRSRGHARLRSLDSDAKRRSRASSFASAGREPRARSEFARRSKREVNGDRCPRSVPTPFGRFAIPTCARYARNGRRQRAWEPRARTWNLEGTCIGACAVTGANGSRCEQIRGAPCREAVRARFLASTALTLARNSSPFLFRSCGRVASNAPHERGDR